MAAQFSLPGCERTNLIKSSSEATFNAGCRNSKEIIYHRRDGHEIAGGIVRQLVVDQWIDRDHTSEREHQCVIVARCKKTHDGRDAVAALTILYDHRLTPTLGKALRE